MGKHNIRMYGFSLFLSQVSVVKQHHQHLDCIRLHLRVSKVIRVSMQKNCCFKKNILHFSRKDKALYECILSAPIPVYSM